MEPQPCMPVYRKIGSIPISRGRPRLMTASASASINVSFGRSSFSTGFVASRSRFTRRAQGGRQLVWAPPDRSRPKLRVYPSLYTLTVLGRAFGIPLLAALGLMLALLFSWATLADAGGRGRGFNGGRGGGMHGGVHGHRGNPFRGHPHHGLRSDSFNHHQGFRHHDGFRHHHAFRHHHKFHGNAFIGLAPVFLWAPSYIHASPVVVEPVPVQPTGYWYYCPSVRAYYPYVAACPESWI